MYNEFYFSIAVTEEQISCAQKLVNYSLQYHPVSNIWDSTKKDKTRQLRLTGTIGEIVFADVYRLPRPKRSFGAIDGQDYGKDFELKVGEKKYIFDVKTMLRKSNIFYPGYVLNIPARNIHRKDSITDNYFCISLHRGERDLIASFLGYISKQDITEGKIGILYPKDTQRIRADQSSFTFFEDTYEIFFKNIKSPFISPRIEKMKTYKKLKLK
jgi:hypothetical protein